MASTERDTMSDAKKLLVLATIVVPFALLASYFLAHAGEPQSVWLWRDVLGMLR